MSEQWLKRVGLEKKAKVLAEEHWEWLEPIIRRFFIDGFIHGYRHGLGSRNIGVSKKDYEILCIQCPLCGKEFCLKVHLIGGNKIALIKEGYERLNKMLQEHLDNHKEMNKRLEEKIEKAYKQMIEKIKRDI